MNSWKMETWLWPLPTRNCSVQNSFLKWIHSNLRFYWVIPNCSCLDVGHRLPKKSALAAKSAVHSQEKGITPSLSTISWGSLYNNFEKKVFPILGGTLEKRYCRSGKSNMSMIKYYISSIRKECSIWVWSEDE